MLPAGVRFEFQAADLESRKAAAGRWRMAQGDAPCITAAQRPQRQTTGTSERRVFYRRTTTSQAPVKTER
jgi:hypothetical protein